MRSVKLATGVILLILLFGSCAESESYKESTIKNIDRIFKHTPRSFSFHVRVSEKESIPTIIYSAMYVRIIYDIGGNELMWAQYIIEKKNSIGDFSTLIIHVRSPDDIAGGDWDHGKSGSGRTNVVQ